MGTKVEIEPRSAEIKLGSIYKSKASTVKKVYQPWNYDIIVKNDWIIRWQP
jgi:hypothetical protein